MLRTIGKTLVGAIAVMCLVSTLAVAAEMICAKDDGKGTCTAATRPDGREEVIVVGPGVKMGEPMDCTDRGTMIECRVVQRSGEVTQPQRMAAPVAVHGEMICAKDDGKGTCTAATRPDGREEVIVVGPGVKTGERMNCTDRGNVVECLAVR